MDFIAGTAAPEHLTIPGEDLLKNMLSRVDSPME